MSSVCSYAIDRVWTFRPPRFKSSSWAVMLCAGGVLSAMANETEHGVTTGGATGGLVIPSAQVLGLGKLSASIHNSEEPAVGLHPRRRNGLLGVGLAPNFELFARLAEYQNINPNRRINGPRDLSVNVKYQVPIQRYWLPQIALGMYDVSGGANYFKSAYGVATAYLGPLDVSVGYARGAKGSASRPVFDGVFAGGALHLGGGLQALAETDSDQRHWGLRYISSPIPLLANAKLSATWQRTSGAIDAKGASADRSGMHFALNVPLGRSDQPARRSEEKELPPSSQQAILGTLLDRLERLQRVLAGQGLDRVRVGQLGKELFVEFENQVYLQSESDALGIVLGLAAEHAGNDMDQLTMISKKSSLSMFSLSVGIPAARHFLRNGGDDQLKQTMRFQHAAPESVAAVRWVTEQPSDAPPLRIEIQPETNFRVGTELGLFEYSVGVGVKGYLPLWRGGELLADYVHEIRSSFAYQPGNFYAPTRIKDGLRTLSVHQSFWLGSQMHTNVGVGKFNYTRVGVQADAAYMLKDSNDMIRIKGALYGGKAPVAFLPDASVQGGMTYRRVFSPKIWLDVSVDRYADTGNGPSVVLTRWFGDTAVELRYQRDKTKQLAGLYFSIPLTPRKALNTDSFILGGTARFEAGARTRILNNVNTVEAVAARPIQLAYDAEVLQRNSGRVSLGHFQGDLWRMRDAFYTFAFSALNQ